MCVHSVELCRCILFHFILSYFIYLFLSLAPHSSYALLSFKDLFTFSTNSSSTSYLCIFIYPILYLILYLVLYLFLLPLGTSAIRLLTHVIQGFSKNVHGSVRTDAETDSIASTISVILTDPLL